MDEKSAETLLLSGKALLGNERDGFLVSDRALLSNCAVTTQMVNAIISKNMKAGTDVIMGIEGKELGFTLAFAVSQAMMSLEEPIVTSPVSIEKSREGFFIKGQAFHDIVRGRKILLLTFNFDANDIKKIVSVVNENYGGTISSVTAIFGEKGVNPSNLGVSRYSHIFSNSSTNNKNHVTRGG